MCLVHVFGLPDWTGRIYRTYVRIVCSPCQPSIRSCITGPGPYIGVPASTYDPSVVPKFKKSPLRRNCVALRCCPACTWNPPPADHLRGRVFAVRCASTLCVTPRIPLFARFLPHTGLFWSSVDKYSSSTYRGLNRQIHGRVLEGTSWYDGGGESQA